MFVDDPYNFEDGRALATHGFELPVLIWGEAHAY